MKPFKPSIGDEFREGSTRWGRRTAAGTIAALAVASSASPAEASTCAPSVRLYAGQTSISQSWAGVTGYISYADHPSAPVNSHSLDWTGLTDPSVGCHTASMCWMQTGYGRGSVGGSSSVGVQPYVEWMAPSVYYVQWLPASSLGSNTKFGVWYAGYTTPGGAPVFNAWVGSSVVGTTPLPHKLNRADANFEAWTGNGGACPAPNSTNNGVFYGTNGSGTYGLGWSFYKLNGSSQWNEWAQVPTVWANLPFTYSNIHQWSAWKVGGV